ncbi:2',5' RNA ligase family [Thiorhodovibrio winogradskyi]|uniref:2',5' RNA ligase family n=1 Tax=Thiorhodovibrio winogradskyi TaxID=77007 RepID=A0ABZ0SBS6_9GAMM|nr:2'-5' RNA ligase family protein [Thiorhodovibrio winogradskyi]
MMTTMLRIPMILLAVFLLSTSIAFGQSNLIAIDVLIQPGPKMVAEAKKWNTALREQYPNGFKLDEGHLPHITLIQMFIAESDLPRMLAAVAQVKSEFDWRTLELTATGLYHFPTGQNGLAGFLIEPIDQLHALQQDVIEAGRDYARKGGDESAFVPDQSGSPFDPSLFHYVETFVLNQTGDRFNPHVTIGVAPLNLLQELEQKPFDKFTFGANDIAIYQLGNFATASKRLDRDR